jgi:hypothetical protein
MDEFRTWGDFLSRGLLPEAGPLQPPESRPRVVCMREPTFDQKLAAIREMGREKFWRETIMEAIPESDSYDWFLTVALQDTASCDREAMKWSRSAIVRYVENVLRERGETWGNYL